MPKAPLEVARLPRLFANRSSDIRSLSIAGHGIGSTQTRSLGSLEFPAVFRLVQAHPDYVTRADLAKLGDRCREADSEAQEELFFATMMWGYGAIGGRSHLNARKAINDGRLGVALEAAAEAVTSHDTAAAYIAFSSPSHVAGYDEGFFTKYLYFLSVGDRTWTQLAMRPLILDSRVLDSLAFLANVLGADWGRITKTASLRRYQRYYATLAAWAEALGCRPVQVERYSFERKLLFTTGNCLRSLACAAMHCVADGSASAGLRSAVDALPADLAESVRWGPFADSQAQ